MQWGVVGVAHPDLLYDFSREGAHKCCDAQLARLGVSCIDIWILTTRRSMPKEELQAALGATKVRPCSCDERDQAQLVQATTSAVCRS